MLWSNIPAPTLSTRSHHSLYPDVAPAELLSCELTFVLYDLVRFLTGACINWAKIEGNSLQYTVLEDLGTTRPSF